MPHDLDIHPASATERRAAFRNVFDVWPMAGDVDAHVARRLASPSHARAEWFVGTRVGRVVTALGCHSLRFRLRGECVPGVAICSVHTVAEERGRGLAERLVRRVEEIMTARGSRLALLYSDIAPAYYERMGYRLCPAWEGRAKPSSAEVAMPRGWRLEAFDPLPHLSELGELFAAFHATRALVIERDEAYWRHLIDRGREDEFLWIRGEQDCRLGYLRVKQSAEGERKLRDFALAEESAESLTALTTALLAHSGRNAIGGWLPDVPAIRERFEMRHRTMEITMLKPLDSALEPTPEEIAAADWFHEIDHV